MPLDFNVHMYKLQSILTSLYTNNIINQKFPGGHLVLASNAFWNKPSYMSQEEATSLGIYNGDKLKSVFDKDGNLVSVECLMPPYYSDMFNSKGELVANLDNLPDFLKEVIGYRIPTSGKHSTCIFKIKGFLPRSAGPMIIVADDIVQRMGSDFDVDSLFLMTPTYVSKVVMNEDGEGTHTEFTIPTTEDVENSNNEITLTDIRNNELLSSYKSILRSPLHAIESIQGAVYAQSEAIREQINEEKGINDEGIDVTSLSGQQIFRRRAQLGKKMIAIAANFSTGIVKLQYTNAQLQENSGINWTFEFADLNMDDTTADNEIMTKLHAKYGANNVTKNANKTVTINFRNIGWNFDGSFTNINGQIITNVLGESVDQSADAVKSPLYSNFNSITSSVKLGLEALGISPLQIARMLNQEAITMYIDANNEGTVITPKSSRYAADSVLNKLYVNLFNAEYGHQLQLKADAEIGGGKYVIPELYGAIKKVIDKYHRIELSAIKSNSKKAIKMSDIDTLLNASSAVKPMLNSRMRSNLIFSGKSEQEKRFASNYWRDQISIMNWYTQIDEKIAIINKSLPSMNLDKLATGPKISTSSKIIQGIFDVTMTPAVKASEGVEGSSAIKGLVYDNDKPLMKAVYPGLFSLPSEGRLYPVLETYLNNSYNVVANRFNSLFITETEDYRKVVDMFNEEIRNLPTATRESFEKYIVYYMNSLTLINNPHLNMNVEEQRRLLGVPSDKFSELGIKGNESLAERIIQAKDKLGIVPTEAHVLNFINPNMDTKAREFNGYNKTYTIDTNNEPGTENAIINSMKYMYFNPTKIDGKYTTKDLVTDIIKVSFLENKLAYGANSTAKFIPHEVLSDLGITQTWELHKEATMQRVLHTDNISDYIDNFLLGYSSRNDIVPVVTTKYDKHLTYVKGQNVSIISTDAQGHNMTRNNTPIWNYQTVDRGAKYMKISATKLKGEPFTVRYAKFVRVLNKEFGTDKYDPKTMNKYLIFYRVKDNVDSSGKLLSVVYAEVQGRSIIDIPGSTQSVIARNNYNNYALDKVIDVYERDALARAIEIETRKELAKIVAKDVTKQIVPTDIAKQVVNEDVDDMEDDTDDDLVGNDYSELLEHTTSVDNNNNDNKEINCKLK